MKAIRNSNGKWEFIAEDNPAVPEYCEAVSRYLNVLDPVFVRAKEASEFDFLLSLLHVRGLSDAGWDPYETTLNALRSIIQVHRQVRGNAQRHLELWLYGHIVEASEPYELLSNLFGIIDAYSSESGTLVH